MFELYESEPGEQRRAWTDEFVIGDGFIVQAALVEHQGRLTQYTSRLTPEFVIEEGGNPFEGPQIVLSEEAALNLAAALIMMMRKLREHPEHPHHGEVISLPV